MTFAEAYAALTVIAAEREDGFSLDVAAWGGTSTPSIKWSVWSTRDGLHYYGSTADEAVHRYREREMDTRGAAEQAINAVGEVSL